MSAPRLQDEIATNQEQQLLELQEFYADDSGVDEEPAWGSDPFDILAYQESQSN